MKRFFLLAYRLFGDKTEELGKIIEDLEPSIKKAGLKYTLEEYAAGMILASIITFVAATLLSFFAMLSVLKLRLGPFPILLSIATGTLSAVAVFLLLYIYPAYRIDSRRREIDADLPYAVTHMATIAGTGVPPHMIFKMMANFPEYKELNKEFSLIVRNTELFGYDITAAMLEAARRTPSEKFKDLLWGIVSTIRSGGDLRLYLKEKARTLLEERRRMEREFLDALSMYAEMYSILFVAAPLLFVLMIAIMSIFGGTAFPISPVIILSVYVYIGVPALSLLFFLFLEAIKPKEVV